MPLYVWVGRDTASTAATTSMKSVYSSVSHQRLARKMGTRMYPSRLSCAKHLRCKSGWRRRSGRRGQCNRKVCGGREIAHQRAKQAAVRKQAAARGSRLQAGRYDCSLHQPTTGCPRAHLTVATASLPCSPRRSHTEMAPLIPITSAPSSRPSQLMSTGPLPSPPPLRPPWLPLWLPPNPVGTAPAQLSPLAAPKRAAASAAASMPPLLALAVALASSCSRRRCCGCQPMAAYMSLNGSMPAAAMVAHSAAAAALLPETPSGPSAGRSGLPGLPLLPGAQAFLESRRLGLWLAKRRPWMQQSRAPPVDQLLLHGGGTGVWAQQFGCGGQAARAGAGLGSIHMASKQTFKHLSGTLAAPSSHAATLCAAHRSAPSATYTPSVPAHPPDSRPSGSCSTRPPTREGWPGSCDTQMTAAPHDLSTASTLQNRGMEQSQCDLCLYLKGKFQWCCAWLLSQVCSHACSKTEVQHLFCKWLAALTCSWTQCRAPRSARLTAAPAVGGQMENPHNLGAQAGRPSEQQQRRHHGAPPTCHAMHTKQAKTQLKTVGRQSRRSTPVA